MVVMEEWGRLSHMFVTVFLSYLPLYLVNPAITDVTVEAVCGGKEECSLAIYLTGFQQAITGLGSVVMMPMIGNPSDAYGRKNLLTIPITLAIVPSVILAWNRTTNFFYAYYAFKTLTAMVTDGGILCLALGYLADSVAEVKRVAVFAVLSGVICGANVCGTLAARLLSTSHIFQVAAVVSIVAAVYMRVFLKDKIRENDGFEQLILNPGIESSPSSRGSSENIGFIKQIPSPKNVFLLLKNSTTFAVAAFVSFFNSLAEAGAQSFLMYFLKARFHFNKDQFALVFLITNFGATLTNVLFMPILGPVVGEETLLSFGLFNGFLSMLLNSIAWSAWVPYASASLGMFFTLSNPCIRSIVSKQVGSNEQGIAQGCILGITSFANVMSPLIFSPLSALFLSEGAPFDFPGFCILCIGFAYLISLILSVMIKINPFFSRDKVSNKDCVEG
ncbi:hypothetical protein Pfo_002961 [Paulownia fortunei]|nr:hypothetical protein Pfo_002961 [Paulownia fortunei]